MQLMSGADRRSEVKSERSEGGAFTLDGTDKADTKRMKEVLKGRIFPKDLLIIYRG